MNRAGLGVISGELVDQSAVQGRGFESGNREARAPIPRTLNLLDIPESTTPFWVPVCKWLLGTRSRECHPISVYKKYQY